MRYDNNERLREYLDRGAAGAYREHLRHSSFELDDAAFAVALADVRETHPYMSCEDAEARAVFRLLTHAAFGGAAVPLTSRWYRWRAWLLHNGARAWPWLKLAWAVAVLVLAAIAAHAEPDPPATNAVPTADTLRALEVQPPWLFQLGTSGARVQFLSSGTWSYVSSGSPFPITCMSGCSAGGAFGDNSAFTVGTTSITPVGGYYTSGSDPTISSGNAGRARIDAHSYLLVDCAVGCGGGSGGTSLADEGAFTQGTTNFTAAGCFYSTSVTNLSGGQGGAFQCTNDRSLFVNLNKVGGAALVLGQTTMANSLPVTLASNQTALSVTATNSFALDGSVNGLLNGQGSTSSGEKGPLNQCAVTASAPGYTTAQTDPLSCNPSGGLRVDGSDVTQPVSGTVTANAGTGTFNIQANASVNLNQVAGSAISTAASGTALVGVADGAGNKLTSNSTTTTSKFGLDTNVLSILGTAPTTAGFLDIKGADGNVFVRQATAANLNVRTDTSGATGAAAPSRADLVGGLGSGSTGGETIGLPVCDTYKAINISTATTALIVTGISGRQVRICAQHMIAAAADNVAWVEGTGATCGTGSAGMAGGTTAASGYNFAANGGIAEGSGVGTVLATVTTGDSVCLVTSAAVQLSGGISYAIY